ncbi:hypothetical protein Tco_0810337 [Tanacetum coccineum]
MVSSGPGNSGCKSYGIPYSEVNSRRYSPEMVDTASSSCIAALTNALTEADKRAKASVVDITFKYRTFSDGSNAQTNCLRDKWPDIQTVTARYTSQKILNQRLRIQLILTLCIWINDYPDHLRCMANEADMHPVVLLIKRGMEQFPGLKAQDRHAVVDRVFEMKVKDMLKLISHLDTLQQVHIDSLGLFIDAPEMPRDAESNYHGTAVLAHT